MIEITGMMCNKCKILMEKSNCIAQDGVSWTSYKCKYCQADIAIRKEEVGEHCVKEQK